MCAVVFRDGVLKQQRFAQKALKGWRGHARGLLEALTTDQGTALAHLDRLRPPEQIFACEAHSPWQKGIVENCNI